MGKDSDDDPFVELDKLKSTTCGSFSEHEGQEEQ